jgi:hypothetical protein
MQWNPAATPSRGQHKSRRVHIFLDQAGIYFFRDEQEPNVGRNADEDFVLERSDRQMVPRLAGVKLNCTRGGEQRRRVCDMYVASITRLPQSKPPGPNELLAIVQTIVLFDFEN